MFPVAEGDFLETFTIMSSFRGPNSLHALGKLQWFTNKVQTLGNDSSFHQQLCGVNSTRKNRCHLAQNLTWTPWKIAMFEGDSVSKPREFGVLFCIFFVNYSLIKLQNCCTTSLDDTKWYNHHPSKADQSSLFKKTHHHTARCGPVVVCLEDRWALARAVPVIRWWACDQGAISCGGDGGFESTIIILTMVYGVWLTSG